MWNNGVYDTSSYIVKQRAVGAHPGVGSAAAVPAPPVPSAASLPGTTQPTLTKKSNSSFVLLTSMRMSCLACPSLMNPLTKHSLISLCLMAR